MRLRTVTTALAALALALTAGCGSSADVAGGDDSSTNAGATSAPDGGGADDSGGDTSLTADNFATVITDAQSKAQTMHLTMSMDMAGQNGAVEADVKADPDPTKTAMRMTMDMAGQSMEMIMVDGSMYMKAPTLPGDKWMSFDLTDSSGPMGDSFSEMTDSMDPAKMIENLDKAMVSVEDSGETETLDGVEARRYDVIVDTSKMEGLDAAGASLPDQLTYEYWIGPDDLPRKVVVEIMGTPTEILFSKWGQDVDISAPPASDVVDGSSLGG